MAQTTPEAMDWSRQLDFAVDWAKQTLLERGAVPQVFIVHSADKIHFIDARATTPDTKRHIQAFIRMFCVACDARALCFASEAWMRRVDWHADEPREAVEKRAARLPPSEAADRVEILVVQMSYRDPETGERRALGRTHEIVRDARGKPIDLKPNELPEDGRGEITGNIINLFPLHPPPPLAREIAQAALERITEALDKAIH